MNIPPDAQPRFIGWYNNHRIRIYEDKGEKPWLVVFDSHLVVDSNGNNIGTAEHPEARERTADAAKTTATALAQNSYLAHTRPFHEKIDWRPLDD
ncbi:MAG TPA: hypothetical protein VME17_05300 [Bryobacteraceae bacterium]|nr:hypothetical protein [Bryobacteraceae bacterium]